MSHDGNGNFQRSGAGGSKDDIIDSVTVMGGAEPFCYSKASLWVSPTVRITVTLSRANAGYQGVFLQDRTVSNYYYLLKDKRVKR